MQDVPNIVRERLRNAATESRHPDADVLAAFAEKSLTERERGAVLEHLARCRNCRHVVALALPELAETVVAPSPVGLSPARGWSWPVLRWGLAVAGVAIVASFGVMQYQKHSAGGNVARLTVSQGEQFQPAAAPDPVESSQAQKTVPSSGAAGTITAADKKADKKENERRVLASSPARAEAAETVNAQRPLSGRQFTELIPLSNSAPQPRRMAPGPIHGVAGGVGSGASVGGPVTGQQQAQQQSLPQVQMAQVQTAPGPISAGGNLRAPDTSTMAAARSQTLTVEVSGAAPLTQTETATLEPPTQTIGSNDADYLSRAKPAMTPQPLPGATVGGLLSIPIPSWNISSDGGLQRSFDQGKTWQDVDVTANSATAMASAQPGNSSSAEFEKVEKKQAAAPTFRTVAAMGPEVWVGGIAGVLYHSVDAGGHWTRVVPIWGGAVLSGDIVSVEFSDAQHGKITTSTSAVWTTSDDGETWQKQ
jgi:hypothetical protein